MIKIETDPANFVSELAKSLESISNEENAAYMTKYMKGLFPFFGIKAPNRSAVLKEHLKEFAIPDNWKQTVEICWESEMREFQYIGMELAFRSKKYFAKEDWKFFESMITKKSWWDTVDYIASNILGHYFFRFPDQIESVTTRWINDDDIWLNRSCILFQLKYKDYTDFRLLQQFIHKHKYSNEFFLQKAIGWSLRQYARTDPSAVRAFVTETELKPLSRKEALKHFS